LIPGPEGLAYIGALSTLLSNGWLGESHINAFTEYVNVRSEGKIWAANTVWAVKMRQIQRASAKKLAADVELENLNQIIHNGACYLLFPVNLDNAHCVRATPPILPVPNNYRLSCLPHTSGVLQ
jgi:hypothetical protein